MEDSLGQNFKIKTRINEEYPVLLNQDLSCPRIKWTENDDEDWEWKCLNQKRHGVDSILKNSEEKERIPKENIDYLIYLPCNSNNHESCSYVQSMKAG